MTHARQEWEKQESRDLAPYAAHAVVSGEGAATFVATVPNLTVRETSEGFVLRAPTMELLVAALNSVPRPPAPIRVSVE